MFVKSARFYDALYGFKDYASASARLHALIRANHPSASSLLDVGCGTGRHLESLKQWYHVEGVDLNADLLDVARERCPDVPLHQGDMVDFALGRRFDVVVCLFSAIAYVRTADRMRAAVANMAAHLDDGGVLVIEPWFSPERLRTGHITANFVNESDLKIAWMYTTTVEDGVSVLDIHYLVGTPQQVEHFTERHELGVFTDEEYARAVESAGLAVQYDAEGLFGRGLYIGIDRRGATGALRPAASSAGESP
jgi:SAM-dependent methyltransferase